MGAAKGAINSLRRMNILLRGGAHTASQASVRFCCGIGIFLASNTPAFSQKECAVLCQYLLKFYHRQAPLVIFSPGCQPSSASCHSGLEKVTARLFLFFSPYSLSLLGRLADELRVEQEHGISASKAAKSLHGQAPLTA